MRPIPRALITVASPACLLGGFPFGLRLTGPFTCPLPASFPPTGSSLKADWQATSPDHSPFMVGPKDTGPIGWCQLVGRCRQPRPPSRGPDQSPISCALPSAFFLVYLDRLGSIAKGSPVSRASRAAAERRVRGGNLQSCWLGARPHRGPGSGSCIRFPSGWQGSLHFLLAADKPCWDSGLGTGGVEPRSFWVMRYLSAVNRRHPWSARHRSRPRDWSSNGPRRRNCAP